MKKPAVKNPRIAAKKSAAKSNSLRVREMTGKSDIVRRLPDSPRGAYLGGRFKVLGDIMESEAQW